MNSGRGQPVRAFEVRADEVVAWYFVMAHWPDPETVPLLQTDSGSIRFVFAETAPVLYMLRKVIQLGLGAPGSLRESAGVLMARLDSELPDEMPPRGSNSNAG